MSDSIIFYEELGRANNTEYVSRSVVRQGWRLEDDKQAALDDIGYIADLYKCIYFNF